MTRRIFPGRRRGLRVASGQLSPAHREYRVNFYLAFEACHFLIGKSKRTHDLV